MPEGQDPDSFVNERGADSFIGLLDEGLALSEFLIQELAGQVDMETVDGRARLAELARPLVSKIPTGVYRELLIESLAATVGLTAPKLEKMIAGSDTKARYPSSTTEGAGGRQPRRPIAGQPSVVRHAITVLLNNPEAGKALDPSRLDDVSRPGTDLLRALIETVQAEPNISTAGLLERWRHDSQGRHLGKLAAAQLPVDEDFDPAAELADCLNQLAMAGRKERIDFLIEKQRSSGLSDEEKAELRALTSGPIR